MPTLMVDADTAKSEMPKIQDLVGALSSRIELQRAMAEERMVVLRETQASFLPRNMAYRRAEKRRRERMTGALMKLLKKAKAPEATKKEEGK
jgi:hypothetical protein